MSIVGNIQIVGANVRQQRKSLVKPLIPEIFEVSGPGRFDHLDHFDQVILGNTRRIKEMGVIMEIEKQKKEKQMLKNTSKKQSDRDVINMTNIFIDHCGLEKAYHFPAEQDLAKYALTKFINKFGITARSSLDFSAQPQTQTIQTDISQTTIVFSNVTSVVNTKIDGCSKKNIGMAQGVQFEDCYRVRLSAGTKEELALLENEYLQILENNNFFQGKTLRFSSSGVIFVACPEITLEEAVVPKKITDEYKLNVIDFLTDEKYHDITMKRALLLYGPPGSGKTTSLRALFSVLRKRGVTCMYLTDDVFKRFSLENVFDFMNKYLSPCLIGFEDIDLIGEDRRNVRGIIGSLLSVLNGVEDYRKPVVIIGTTNRADVLDDAVTRPCRFDRKLKIDYPSTKALQQMFKNIMGFDAPAGVIKQTISKENKLTGAHIKEICNTAKMLAKKNNTEIKDCLKEAIEIIKESFYLPRQKAGFGFSSDDGGEREEDLFPTKSEEPIHPNDDPFLANRKNTGLSPSW